MSRARCTKVVTRSSGSGPGCVGKDRGKDDVYWGTYLGQGITQALPFRLHDVPLQLH